MVRLQDVLDSRVASGLTVEAIAGRPARIRLAGELDYGTAPRLRAALAHVPDGDCVIDCGALTFIDSLGIGLLVRYSVAFEEQGRHLVLCDLRESVRRTLELSGVLDRLVT
jgi:anti-anti-sigma factor